MSSLNRLAMLAEHKIREVPKTDVRAFYLEPPGGGRSQSSLLTFSPEGITITGDLRPGAGLVCHGRDLAWFLSDLPVEDLCSAFNLQEGWHPELAVRDLQELWVRLDQGPNLLLDGLRKLVRLLEAGEVQQERMLDLLIRNGWCDRATAATIGTGYDPAEAGWLLAIQRRFRETWPHYQSTEWV